MALGHYQPLEQLLEPDVLKSRARKEAVILKSTGDLEHWSKVYSGRGELLALSVPEPARMYALGVAYTETGEESSYLLSTSDLGQTWSPRGTPPSGAVGLAFHASEAGYTWSREHVWHTEDGGRTWKQLDVPVQLLDGWPPPAVHRGGTLWSVSDQGLQALEPRGQRRVVPLPLGFKAEGLVLDPEGRPWLVGHWPARGESGRGATLLVEQSPGVLQSVSELPGLLPEHLHVGASTMVLIASDIQSTSPRSKVLVSTDRGRRWKAETPALSRGLRAVFFESDEVLWTAGPAEQIQRRRP